MSTLKLLDTYREQLRKWIARDGLNGGGGDYSREQRKYLAMSEPLPPAKLTDYETLLAKQIREYEVRRHAVLHPKIEK